VREAHLDLAAGTSSVVVAHDTVVVAAVPLLDSIQAAPNQEGVVETLEHCPESEIEDSIQE
jgi:hypothetical protein